LHENGDGTFSILNPETSKPYPGTLGMEKEKPYQCIVCEKRYKTRNGLKYVRSSATLFFMELLTKFQHMQHSTVCKAELELMLAGAS
jgi:transcription factor SFP1